jgi:hypothetical protein
MESLWRHPDASLNIFYFLGGSLPLSAPKIIFTYAPSSAYQ